MAVELSRVQWLGLFEQMGAPRGFLSRMFTMKPNGLYMGEKVAMDIERFGEDVAVAVKAFTGVNLNDVSEFTTKEFTPPSYGEAFPLDVSELMKRMAGVDPYSAADIQYSAQMVAIMMKGFRLVYDKIQRAIEQQASQILQTGKLSLTNADGDVVYELDFKPKSAHFPTVSVAWSNASTCTPADDISALAELIRSNGKVTPDRLIFGQTALSEFLASTQIKELLDNRRIEVGAVFPQFEGSGATFYGHIWINAYRYEMWAYPEEYKSPETGLPVKYIGTNKVSIMSSRTRLDLTSAIVPLLVSPDPRVASMVPGRVSSTAVGVDVTPNVYVSTDNRQIMGELLARPLLLPVQIDGFGCLTT